MQVVEPRGLYECDGIGSFERLNLFDPPRLGGSRVAVREFRFLRKAGVYDGGYSFSSVGSVNDTTWSIRVFWRGAAAAFRYKGNDPNEATEWWTEEAQGLAGVHGQAWFVTNAWYIAKYPWNRFGSGETAWTLMPEPLTELGCNHFGDPDVFGDWLFVPVENCSGGPKVAVFDIYTLDFIRMDDLYFQGAAALAALTNSE